MSDAHIPSPGGESGPASEPERQPDDLHIEVSDLRRPSQRSGSSTGDSGTVPWHRQHVQVPRPVVAAAIVVMLGLTLLVATPVGSSLLALVPRPTPTAATVHLVFSTAAPASPTPSPYPAPTLIAPAIGAVPANCPLETPLVDFAPDTVAPGVGGADVWLVGFSGPGTDRRASGQRATAKIGSLHPSDYTRVGWPVQVLVLIKSGFTQTITLTGRDLRTGYSLWFSPDANNPGSVEESAPLAVIDPSQPMGAAGDYSLWFGVLYLPGAGCYTLQANWPGNGWVVNFAAGR